jgi:hypothetical protein
MTCHNFDLLGISLHYVQNIIVNLVFIYMLHVCVVLCFVNLDSRAQIQVTATWIAIDDRRDA